MPILTHRPHVWQFLVEGLWNLPTSSISASPLPISSGWSSCFFSVSPVSTLLSLSSSLTFQSIIATLTFNLSLGSNNFLQPLPSNTPNPEVLISEIKRLRDRWSHFHFLIISSYFHFPIISSFQIFSSHFHLLIIILSLSLSHQQDQETARQVFSLSLSSNFATLTFPGYMCWSRRTCECPPWSEPPIARWQKHIFYAKCKIQMCNRCRLMWG